MSLADTQKLTAMAKSMPNQIKAATAGLGAIQSQIDNLTKQKDAITDLCGTATSGVTDKLAAAAADIGGSVSYGANFGSISQTGNLTDYVLKDAGGFPIPTPPSILPAIQEFGGDFSFSSDFLTKPFPDITDIASGAAATYGIDAKLALLNKGKSIMGNNLNKLKGAADIFNKYGT